MRQTRNTEMSVDENQPASPGDIVEIIWDCDVKELKFLVVECPPERLNEQRNDCVWVIYVGSDIQIPRHWYKIVKRNVPVSQDTKDVDEHLKRQRDDNLASIFR